MPKLYFAPSHAVRYIGKEPKEFAYSLARPKPMLENGDIVVVDKRTAHTLTRKGFGEFEEVDNIALADAKTSAKKTTKKASLVKQKI